MRIPFSSSFDTGVLSISRASEAVIEAQRQVASGRRISRPHDDPLGSAAAITEHATLSHIDAYENAADAAAYRLGLADNVLSDIVNQLTSAQSTALAARGSSLTAGQRDAAAGELLSIRDAVASDINTKFEGIYLFSGSKVTVPPFVPAGSGFSAYQGDATPTQIDIGSGRAVANTFDGGRIVQGSDSQNVLDVLTDLATAISANDGPTIAAKVDALNRAFDRSTAAQARIGNDLRSVADDRLQLSTNRVGAVERISGIEDADIVEASARLSQADTAYRAALAAMATVGRLSLMDYLK